ncbi:MAG: PilW family protein [Pseudomonadota bacterium]
MLRRQQGASLLELIIAGALGLLVIAALQQVWVWQQGEQQQRGSASRSLLTAQSLLNQLLADISEALPEQVELNDECFLLPQRSGRLLAYRVRDRQLQRHTLAPYCPTYGWQSLSHFSSLAIKSLQMQLQPAGKQLHKLSLRLLAKSPKASDYHAFYRELVLTEGAN